MSKPVTSNTPAAGPSTISTPSNASGMKYHFASSFSDVHKAAGVALGDVPGPSAAKNPIQVGLDQESKPILVAKNIHKSYRKGKIVVPVLRGATLDVRQGEFLAIVGQSGSGKTTLLHLLGCLDSPDEGEILYAGTRLDRLSVRARDRLRNEQIGMIFQFYHLLPELSTLENVLTPVMIRLGVWSYWWAAPEHRRRAMHLLNLVGLEHRAHHRPRELSGGEMQRAAIARALMAGPQLLLADEPTGNLDQATGRDILRLLQRLNREQGLTVVMVTHDPAIARQADRIVTLAGGVVESR